MDSFKPQLKKPIEATSDDDLRVAVSVTRWSASGVVIHKYKGEMELDGVAVDIELNFVVDYTGIVQTITLEIEAKG